MENPIILFDGVCNLCNGAVQFIIRMDKKEKFRFASLQSETGQKWLEQYGLPMDSFGSMVLIIGDKYFIKSSAVLHISKELGGIFRMFYGLIVLPKPLRDFVYDLVAKSRYKLFGKNDSCMVPSPALKQRFLS
ncbi:thiol-disulfide oxidoreductase DCC family protein [Pedobacter sp. KR3-3]|uniref:Thiol-disulfide oxidoreductase DCC family protein n=1 Tax=Pedobacter albus TaxID=3113905 RepID=A0ABU7I873_9SPHI|nr:thiol-disulfide oxidoreductase DCC family protein [Pedobacter sp. KR3-3]MEE1945589.1 thiol-disulfide oxidoreductase DCC family protein [Pedobacter sp. KR3-3]